MQTRPQLLRVPLGLLRPHPANPNVMDEEHLAKLQKNILRQGEYPPLVVRPDPVKEDAYQIIDGAQRLKALAALGHTHALCFVWPCDDQQALLLLATLNRLRGEDEPTRRAELLAELSQMMTLEELATLLPEDAGMIRQTLAMLDLDVDALIADLNASSSDTGSPRLLSFMVLAEDEQDIERAVRALADTMAGRHRRGRALAALAREHLEREVRDG